MVRGLETEYLHKNAIKYSVKLVNTNLTQIKKLIGKWIIKLRMIPCEMAFVTSFVQSFYEMFLVLPA